MQWIKNADKATRGVLCMAALLGLSAQVEATQVREIPESCFINSEAHKTYVAAKRTFDKAPNNDHYFEALRAEKLKPVTVDVNQSQSAPGEPITLDASTSTVTSGHATYLWKGFASREPVLIIPAGNAGEISLTVVDEVCGNSQPQHIMLISK